jgi:replicative DNA helicase Mcm
LIGDPGVAKSVLCDFSVSITPGSRKAVGGGSSAVGITASVVKEEESLGGYRVEPGAMILAKELFFLDELNNLSDEDKPKLQEGMNEQTVSINKANLHVQMKVTGGILAGANPKNGHFITGGKESIQEQFNIPSPILNRFDSIFVLQDEVNEKLDKQIAENMLKRQRGILKPEYSKEFLKDFFAYIRHFPEPKISEEISKKIQNLYSEARNTYNQGVKINPRFLESLTRMAISSAKLRLSEEVNETDLIIALKILSKSQYKVSELIYLRFKDVLK